MSLLDKKTTVELSIAEAMVIYNFISRQSDFKNGVAELTPDEKRALWNIECLLEKILTEPLICNYQDTLAEAKKLLTDDIDAL